MSAITAITAQNTLGVTGVHAIPADMVAAQIDAVATDIGVDAAKTGMLGTAAIVEAVADAVDRHGIRQLVVDPVMISTSGATLSTTPPARPWCGCCSRVRWWSRPTCRKPPTCSAAASRAARTWKPPPPTCSR